MNSVPFVAFPDRFVIVKRTFTATNVVIVGSLETEAGVGEPGEWGWEVGERREKERSSVRPINQSRRTDASHSPRRTRELIPLDWD